VGLGSEQLELVVLTGATNMGELSSRGKRQWNDDWYASDVIASQYAADMLVPSIIH
jgi:hypothetical protein